MARLQMTLHADGTLTYWSVYRQSWVEHVWPVDVPDRELAAMPQDEREQIIQAAEKARAGHKY